MNSYASFLFFAPIGTLAESMLAMTPSFGTIMPYGMPRLM